MKALCVTLNPALDKYFHLPAIKIDALNRTDKLGVMTAGGKGINVSRTLSVWKDEAINLYFAGGHTGKMLENLLCDEGLCSVVIPTKAPTRICVKIVSGDTYTEINERGGPMIAKEETDLIHSFDAVLKTERPDCVILSGSVPSGIDADIYIRMLERAAKLGIPAVLDCDGTALKKGIGAKPFLIKPNHIELSQLVERELCGESEVADACKKLYADTGVEILCTRGKDGAVYAGKGGVFTVNSPKVNAVFPAGAGDTFLGGFISAYFKRKTPKECLVRAVCTVSAKLESANGLSQLPKEEKYLDQIIVRQIS